LLKAAFPDAEIDHLRTNASVGKYLTYKSDLNDIGWAKAFVAKKLGTVVGATRVQQKYSINQRTAAFSAAAAGSDAEVDAEVDETYDSDPDWQEE
jgi:hypothetical protein